MPNDAFTGTQRPAGFDEIWQLAVEKDGRLPPETEIAELLGMGRNSVREALIRLEADGYISRRHGAGTFANPAAMDVRVRIDRTAEFAEIVRRAGYTPQVQLLEAGWQEWTPEIRALLPENDGALLFKTRKRWLADGIPVMVAEDYIPAPARADVDATAAVFEIARDLTGVSTEWVCSWINATLAGQQGPSLNLEPGHPVLRFDQVGVSREGRHCWLAQEHHNSTAQGLDLRYGLIRTMSI